MSEIPHEVRAVAALLKDQAKQLSASVRALKATRYGEPLRNEISDLLVTLAGHHAEINRLQSLVSAAGMVGVLEARPAMRAEALELHPDHRPREDDRQQRLMLETLHRAGDHTLDPEPMEVKE